MRACTWSLARAVVAVSDRAGIWTPQCTSTRGAVGWPGAGSTLPLTSTAAPARAPLTRHHLTVDHHLLALDDVDTLLLAMVLPVEVKSPAEVWLIHEGRHKHGG